VCVIVAKINEVDAGEEGDDNITFDDCDVDDDDIDEVRLLMDYWDRWQIGVFNQFSSVVDLFWLPCTLCQIPVDHCISFFSTLKTVLFGRGWAESASE